MKPKVGVQSLTGCAGCQLSIYFIEDVLPALLEHINLVAAPMIKGKNSDGPYDVLFVEGGVVHDEDLRRLKEFRQQAKVLVALGACAVHGGMQTIKNFGAKAAIENEVYKKKDHLKSLRPSPLSEQVEVELVVPGCPPNKDELVKVIKDLAMDKTPRIYDNPVCIECIIKENVCVLGEGRPCLGPSTRGNCGAACPSVNHGCTGCRGPTSDKNMQQHIQLLRERGLDDVAVSQFITKYAPKQYREENE